MINEVLEATLASDIHTVYNSNILLLLLLLLSRFSRV